MKRASELKKGDVVHLAFGRYGTVDSTRIVSETVTVKWQEPYMPHTYHVNEQLTTKER